MTQFTYLSIESLEPGQYQPRKDFNLAALEELANSIATMGIIEPLVVRLMAKGRYEIIAGERRFRAAKLAKLKEVPCLIGEYTDRQACALTLVENIQRADLNLIEEGQGYQRLIQEFHYQQDEIAVLVGKSRSHVANILRLLTLEQSIKQLIQEGLLSLGHARMLVGQSAWVQSLLSQKIIDEQWSVRKLEEEIKLLKNNSKLLGSSGSKDKDVERLERVLAEQVGSPVHIDKDVKEGGWLKVKFFDNDTLEGLLERLGLSYD